MSPERVPITKPSSGVKPIEVSTLLPLFTAVMLAPLPRCAMIRRPTASARIGGAELLKNVLAGEAVEAVAPEAFVVELARQSIRARDFGQGGMKRRVEAADLRRVRQTVAEEADILNCLRCVIGVQRGNFFEFGQDFGCDSLGLGVVRAAVDEAVADSGEMGYVVAVLEPLEDRAQVGIRAGLLDAGIEEGFLGGVGDLDPGLGRACSIDFDRGNKRG